VKPLTDRQARACETARTPRCRCRCKGALHGGQRPFLELLPDSDPHRVVKLNQDAADLAGDAGRARGGRIVKARLNYLRSRVSLFDLAGRFTELLPYSRSEAVGLCPFHPESVPSFFVNRETGRFYCHGCAAGGDLFRFVEVLCGCSFRDAVRQVARLGKGRSLSMPTIGLAAYRSRGVLGGRRPPTQTGERTRVAWETHRQAVALGAMRSALSRESELPRCVRAELLAGKFGGEL